MRSIHPILVGALALAAPGAAFAEETPPTMRLGYEKGFLMATSDELFELKLVGRLQARWELFRPDADDAELAHRFSIPRMRVTLEGHAFRDVDYKVQTEFGRGLVYLRDAYLDRPLGAGVRARAGQWKRPFSRQQITSSGSLQLVDRAPTDAFFGAGRDIGVALHNGYERSPEGLEWAVGVFNGTGDKPRLACSASEDPATMAISVACKDPTNVPADIGPTLVARAGWNVGRIKAYSESDLEGGPLRLAVGVSYLGQLAEGDADAMIHNLQADAVVKAHGVSVTGGVYLTARRTEADETATDVGFHVQGGVFVLPRRVEVVARVTQVPSAAVAGEDAHEAVLGFNWFAEGHALKWQTQAGVLHTTGVDTTDVALLTQAQLVF